MGALTMEVLYQLSYVGAKPEYPTVLGVGFPSLGVQVGGVAWGEPAHPKAS